MFHLSVTLVYNKDIRSDIKVNTYRRSYHSVARCKSDNHKSQWEAPDFG